MYVRGWFPKDDGGWLDDGDTAQVTFFKGNEALETTVTGAVVSDDPFNASCVKTIQCELTVPALSMNEIPVDLQDVQVEYNPTCLLAKAVGVGVLEVSSNNLVDAAGVKAVYILMNDDDDNGDGVPDFFEAPVTGEDDLAAVTIRAKGPRAEGADLYDIYFAVNTGDNHVALYKDAEKREALGAGTHFLTPGEAYTFYVEGLEHTQAGLASQAYIDIVYALKGTNRKHHSERYPLVVVEWDSSNTKVLGQDFTRSSVPYPYTFQNKVCYNAATLGYAVFRVSGKLLPAVPAEAAALLFPQGRLHIAHEQLDGPTMLWLTGVDEKAQWTLDSIPWAKTSYYNPNTGDVTIPAKLRTLPKKNSGFGPKTLAFSFDESPGNVTFSKEYKLFYLGAKGEHARVAVCNHPDQQGDPAAAANWPNWFYYWATTHSGGKPVCSYALSGNPFNIGCDFQFTVWDGDTRKGMSDPFGGYTNSNNQDMLAILYRAASPQNKLSYSNVSPTVTVDKSSPDLVEHAYYHELRHRRQIKEGAVKYNTVDTNDADEDHLHDIWEQEQPDNFNKDNRFSFPEYGAGGFGSRIPNPDNNNKLEVPDSEVDAELHGGLSRIENTTLPDPNATGNDHMANRANDWAVFWHGGNLEGSNW